MKTPLILITLVTTACLDKAGPQGKAGAPGAQGPEGPPGEALVWKDASGAVVDGAYPAFHDHTFTMLVRNGDGAMFEISALGGAPVYAEINSVSSTRYYLTTNCSGPARLNLSVAPGVAFKYDGRVVAMPADVDVATSINSYSWTGGCSSAPNSIGAFVPTAALDALPTLAPPLIGPGPYHIEAM